MTSKKQMQLVFKNSLKFGFPQCLKCTCCPQSVANFTSPLRLQGYQSLNKLRPFVRNTLAYGFLDRMLKELKLVHTVISLQASFNQQPPSLKVQILHQIELKNPPVIKTLLSLALSWRPVCNLKSLSFCSLLVAHLFRL